MSLTCRVQYVDDTDPFEYSANVPEPQRSPPVHSFSLTLPLINQIAGVYKVLRAPHRVSPAALLTLSTFPTAFAGKSVFLQITLGTHHVSSYMKTFIPPFIPLAVFPRGSRVVRSWARSVFTTTPV